MKQFHFYASSLGEWKVSDDLEKLIKHMKKSKLPFALWKVPGDKSSRYEIRTYVPVVKGRVYLGMYLINGSSWRILCKEYGRDDDLQNQNARR